MRVGKFNTRKTCRICGSYSLELFLDLGFMPHAGDFLKKSEVGKEYKYPLRIYRCRKCGLVQILDVISTNTLFKNYHYLSSVSLSPHFEEYAEEMSKKFLAKNTFVVEIGSNDGVLLLPLKKRGINVLGVDPSANVAKIARKKGVKTITVGFGLDIAKDIVKENGKADAIFANNVLAHIDDIKDVFEGIEILLKKDGVLVAEVHYFPELLKKNQYDFFYNEHLCYYSLKTFTKLLKLGGLTPFDAKTIPIHSGSIRIYAKFIGNNNYPKTKRLIKLENSEDNISFKSLADFSKKVETHKKDLLSLLNKIKGKNEKIVGYGASGRANTLLNYCGIDTKILDCIVDESPERYGKFTPGTHIPIVNPDYFRRDKKVKFALLLAWNYKSEILGKEKKFVDNGGRFIVPFPKIKNIR